MTGRGFPHDLVILDEVYRMPARDSGDAEPEPVELPIIIVSSRDGVPVPRVGPAVRLETAAVAAGWLVRQTYALASVPERRYLNGNVRKSAHMLATVTVRMSRRRVNPQNGRTVGGFGFATWRNEDDHGWRFAHAFIGGRQIGARSIVEALR